MLARILETLAKKINIKILS